MRDGVFMLGGRSSDEFPCFIRERPKKLKAKRLFDLETVSGVDKLVPLDKGFYTNASLTLSCFYLVKNMEDIQYTEDLITDWLDTRGQYVDYIPYYDDSYSYQVVVVNEPTFEGTRNTKLGVPFSFDVSVAPFKEKLYGRTVIEITEPIDIFNHETYSSNPRIKIIGSGDITISINNRTLVLKDVAEHIIVDSDPDIQEVYKEVNGVLINENAKMRSFDFPYFDSGQNRIEWIGNVEKIEVEGRWRTKI